MHTPRLEGAATGQKLIRWLRPFRQGTIDHWRICVRRSDSPKLLAERSHDKSGFHWLPSPPGHYYADPFLLQDHGQVWLFFEDYSRADRRGCIRCAALGADLSMAPPTVCLKLPYHVSYPLVFHHDGEAFMIPETRQNHSVELWRATAFPHKWTLEKRLFSGPLVDTVPIFHGDRWYFFTTEVSERNDRSGALFSSDALLGGWVRHPHCPISTNPRFARSAGAIVKVGERWLRPVQDCNERYGRRIHVQEILELTPEVYRERYLHSIEPDWDPELAGVHTYGFCGDIEVLDAVNLANGNAKYAQAADSVKFLYRRHKRLRIREIGVLNEGP